MPPCFPETNSSHFITMKLFNTKYYDYCGVTTQGITTYDYIIALREQEQQGIGGQQSPQMSPVSSLTGMSSASSFSTFHRGAWCTPPRLFLEDQVTFSFQFCYLLNVFFCILWICLNFLLKWFSICSTCTCVWILCVPLVHYHLNEWLSYWKFY